jgi:hypothetical protein
MAELNAAGKLRTYQIIYRLNLSFANIVTQCRLLKESRVITPRYARLYQSFVQELQAEINQDVMSVMEGIEADDSFRYGKVRTAWEKEISDPDDVFLKAEERRKEIARERKAKKHLTKAKKGQV